MILQLIIYATPPTRTDYGPSGVFLCLLFAISEEYILCKYNNVLIGFTQLGTRCGYSPCEAAEDLIAGFVLFISPAHSRVDSAQKIPCRFVTDAQRAAQLNGRNAAFVRGTEIDRPEPDRQRQMRAVHDRPGGDGRLMPADTALERVSPANWVIFRTPAFRADEAVRKPKPE